MSTEWISMSSRAARARMVLTAEYFTVGAKVSVKSKPGLRALLGCFEGLGLSDGGEVSIGSGVEGVISSGIIGVVIEVILSFILFFILILTIIFIFILILIFILIIS